MSNSGSGGGFNFFGASFGSVNKVSNGGSGGGFCFSSTSFDSVNKVSNGGSGVGFSFGASSLFSSNKVSNSGSGGAFGLSSKDTSSSFSSNKVSYGESGDASRSSCTSSSFSTSKARKVRIKTRRKAPKTSSFAPFESSKMECVISEPPSDDSQHKKQTVQQDGVNVKQDLNGNKSKNPTEIKHSHDQVSNSPLPMVLISRILKGIPQSPHFLQLHRYSEMARENLVAAWDRTYEETVDQIHALRAAEFWVRASKLWKTLGELQSLGYNVLVLRKRVVELSDVVLEHRKCEHEIRGLRNRAEFHRMEKSRVESVIVNLKAQAQREHERMVQVLENVAEKEKNLPKLEGVVAKLASEPMEM